MECTNAPGMTSYCSVAVQTDPNYITPGMGICVPSECSETTLTKLNQFLVVSPEQGQVVSVKCQAPLEWSDNMTIVVTMCSALALLIFFATAVDGFMVIGLFAEADDKQNEKEADVVPLLGSINGGVDGDDELGLARRINSRRRRRGSMYTRKIWRRSVARFTDILSQKVYNDWTAHAWCRPALLAAGTPMGGRRGCAGWRLTCSRSRGR